MENNNGGNKFLNGFLLGALIGAGAVFLLSSKKGKQLLKTLSEEGLDNISELLQQEDQIVDDEENELEQEKKEPNREEGHTQEINKKPLVKRFFRGISRKP
jgi:gas vesicle protein